MQIKGQHFKPIKDAVFKLSLCVCVGVLSGVWGCYAHQGQPRDERPEALFAQAQAACARQDHRASAQLLTRLLKQDTPNARAEALAQRAREWLDHRAALGAGQQPTTCP